jgi:hypothetical protein
MTTDNGLIIINLGSSIVTYAILIRVGGTTAGTRPRRAAGDAA